MQKRPAQCLAGFADHVHSSCHNAVHGVSGFWVEWFVFMVKKYLSIWSLRIFFFLLYRFALELVFAKSRWEVGMCLFNSLLYLKVFSHFGHFSSTFAGLCTHMPHQIGWFWSHKITEIATQVFSYHDDTWWEKTYVTFTCFHNIRFHSVSWGHVFLQKTGWCVCGIE